MNIEDFKRKQAELAAELAEHGKTALLQGFEALFREYPSITAVRWHQYTPYFNDGEPCTFSVGDLYFSADCLDPDSGDYDDGFHRDVSLWRKTDEEKAELAPLVAFCDGVRSALSNLEGRSLQGVYLAAFGDHSQVTVRRDLTVEVEEYEHD